MNRLTATVLVAGVGLCGANVWGQYSGAAVGQPRYPSRMPPRPMPGDEEEDGGGDEPLDMEGMYGMRYGRGGMEMDPAMRPKTDLGKKIFQLDFTRTPQTVLGARAKLAAKARERALNPDAPEKPDEVMPDAVPGMPGAGGDEEGIGGMNLPGGADLPPEMLARLAAMGVGSGGNSGAVGSILPPPGEAGEEGAEPKAAGGVESAKTKAEAAKEKAKKKLEEATKVAAQAERFQRMAVAGDWAGVGEFLKKEAGEDAGAIYSFVLSSLERMDQALVPDEVLAISEAAPGELTDKHVTKLGALLKATHRRGSEPAAVAAKIARGTTHFGGQDPEKRKKAASLLVAAGLPIEAVAYLAPVEEARASKDAELLILHAVYFKALARTQQGAEKQATSLKGWPLIREALQVEKATKEQRNKALNVALDLLAEVPAEEGDAWLAEVFGKQPDLGWKLVDTANTREIMMRMRQAQAEDRVKQLELLRRLGRAILAGTGEALPGWRSALDMVTMTLMDEAQYTKQLAQMQAQNPYAYQNPYGDGRQQQPIPAERLTPLLPDPQWLAAIDPGLAAKLELMVATTQTGSGETTPVMTMIGRVVASDPKRALKLAESLLQAWPSYVKQGRMDDMDGMYGGYGGYAGRYNPYMYSRMMYGGGGYGIGTIPLTRAKQQRNLEQLRGILADLAKLKVGPLPAPALVTAFAASHSDAEVYRLEDIERVFGALEEIPAASRLKLAENMRQRLAGIWRRPQVQQEAQTKRSDKELAAEVVRGYELALKIAPAPEKAGDEAWAAASGAADLSFDMAEFLYGQNADLKTYTERRNAAFAGYATAAKLYGGAIDAGKIQPSARVYSQWFNAALGASDLGYLTRQDTPEMDQIDAVKAAIAALPEAQAKKHVGLFAKAGTKALNELAPELRPRFARHAVRIVGDHEDGADLRKRLAYYDDLVKEIELSLAVDGSSDVGHGEPFGVQLAVWATRAVSREGGGFGKYLMNEQYNPATGQPVNYKDDLEKKLRETLSEKFEVLAINFHKPEVQPVGLPRAGWEQFPLAYLLLKARDASVDRLPPVHMDMDFSDGNGMVILPVASPVALIDARDQKAPARTAADLTVEQVLDDRKAGEGMITLEVRAKAKGLVPALEQLVDMSAVKGLSADKVEDHGISIDDLDTSTSAVVPVTSRSVLVTFKPTGVGKVETFAFPPVRAAGAKGTLKRYADADIVEAKAVAGIAPVAVPGRTGVAVAIAAAFGVMSLGVFAYLRRRRSKGLVRTAPLFSVPAMVTPVGTIGLLRKILELNGTVLPAAEQAALSDEIRDLERSFFAPPHPANGDGKGPPADGDLRVVCERWVRRANR